MNDPIQSSCPDCAVGVGEWCRDVRRVYRLRYWYDGEIRLELEQETVYGDTRQGFSLVHPSRWRNRNDEHA